MAFAAGATGKRLGGGLSQLFLDFTLIRGILRGFVSPETAWALMPHKYLVTAAISVLSIFLATCGGWRGVIWFLGGFLLTAVLSLQLAVLQTPAQRYFFAPSVILLVMLIAGIDLTWATAHGCPLSAVLLQRQHSGCFYIELPRGTPRPWPTSPIPTGHAGPTRL